MLGIHWKHWVGCPILDMAVLQNKESNIPGRVLLKLCGEHCWGAEPGGRC